MKEESYFKSIKLDIEIDDEYKDILFDYIKRFNNLYRYSYNRHVDNPNISLKELSELNNKLNNTIKESHISRCANIKAKMKFEQTKAINSSYKKDLEKKINNSNDIDEINRLNKKLNKIYSINFGGKESLKRRSKGLITNEEYKLNRMSKIYIQGEEKKTGNRHFKLDIDNNLIIFKLNKDAHIPIKIKLSGKNYRKQLKKLQEINNIKHGETGKTFSVYLDMDSISISFEPFEI